MPTPFTEARDEFFQHIMQCGVIGADPSDQKEWFDATMKYLEERFPELRDSELRDLRSLGERFAQPPKRAEVAAV
ncbi:MAG: plasmid recombination protein [Gemmatimonadaceae bacterium]|nr:plasmid recombination protein [Gemmatimonadaceae bacterium]